MASTLNRAKRQQTPPKLKRRAMPNHVAHNLKGVSPMCAPVRGIRAHSGHYGATEKFGRPGEEYVALVGQNVEGSWYFIRISPNECLDTSHQPVVYPMHLANELFDIWKRVVLDNAIPWDSGILSESIRIVSYKVEAKDITLSLAGDYDEAKEIMRLNAMSKLSDDEAKLLGLTHMKAKQKLMYNPVFHKDDKIMLKNLEDETIYMNTDAMMRPLTEG